MNFFNKEFTLIDDKKDRLLLIVICLIFGVLFVNLFVPFNINRWMNDSGIVQFLRLSSYGFIVALVLLISQFPARKLLGVKRFKVKTYIIWFTSEITLISFVYILLYGNIVGNLYNDLVFSLKYTFLGICLPYSFALLIIYYKKHIKEIKNLKTNLSHPIQNKLLSLKDEKGKLRYSILNEKLLFFESTDNYVSFFYLQDGKIKRELLRNSLKNMEDQLKEHSFKRCHRSYLVNIQNLEYAHIETKRMYLKIKANSSLIPVSKKYSSLFQDFLSHT